MVSGIPCMFGGGARGMAYSGGLGEEQGEWHTVEGRGRSKGSGIQWRVGGGARGVAYSGGLGEEQGEWHTVEGWGRSKGSGTQWRVGGVALYTYMGVKHDPSTL